MTQFNLETTNKLSIQSYDDGEINIALSGSQAELESSNAVQCMTRSFILTPSQIIKDWNYNDVAEFTLDSFQPLIDQQPELVILGTGKTLTFPNHQILQSFQLAGIGVEVMNTASACRTFNVLVSENRYVIAGLLII